MDLIEIDRIARALERPRFRERVYTEAERAYCDSKANPAQSYAARFAGKEAVGKALGCGVDFAWREIEIVGRPKPSVKLSGRTLAFAEKHGLTVADLSMTHSRGVAGAGALVNRPAQGSLAPDCASSTSRRRSAPTRPSGPAWRTSARRRSRPIRTAAPSRVSWRSASIRGRTWMLPRTSTRAA